MADEESQAAIIDDWLEGDYASFDDCCARAGVVREGYWSPFVTLAWIASRDETFTAATQIYEAERDINRGGYYAGGAWLVLGNAAGRTYGRTFTDAEGDLRLELEADRLKGGIAKGLRTGEVGPVARHKWTQWSVVFDQHGVSLLPGLSDFRWPSEEVRRAFPPNLQPSIEPDGNDALPEHSPTPWSEQMMIDAIRACTEGNREKAWATVFRPKTAEHGWTNGAFREIWSKGRNTKGLTGRPQKGA